MHKYYSANQYFKDTFGCKVYKIALDGGMTCPHRVNGKGGCIFCSEGGSGDFAQKLTSDADAQIELAINRVKDKNPKAYIAYFQSFTNTYAPLGKLEKLFYPAINHPKICALSIATRPDCLGKDVLDLLKKLNRIKPVFVELGLQTADDNVAKVINRCYETKVFENAVRSLKEIGVNVIAHIILGLPKSEPDDGVKTVKFAVKCGVNGIKLQLLHVLKNTVLGEMYENGEYTPLEEDVYISMLCDCIKEVPENVVVHRITGDAPKKLLLAPLWSANKKAVLNHINAEFSKQGITQIVK